MAKKGDWTTFAILQASQGGKEWKVEIDKDGNFRCNCPSYIFCKQQPRTCKHCKRCQEEQKLELQGKVRASTTNVIRPTVPPMSTEAQSMFDAMCAAATVKVRFNVKDQIGKEASKIMLEVLAAKLALFNPAAAAAMTSSEPEQNNVRRITFDD